jgi:hypothetical protein
MVIAIHFITKAVPVPPDSFPARVERSKFIRLVRRFLYLATIAVGLALIVGAAVSLTRVILN